MAVNNLVQSGDFRLHLDVDNNGTLITISRAKDISVAFDSQSIDITTKDTPTNETESMNGAIKASISGNAYMTETTLGFNLSNILTYQKTSAKVKAVLTDNLTNTPKIAGDILFRTANVDAQGNSGPASISYTAEFSGGYTLS